MVADDSFHNLKFWIVLYLLGMKMLIDHSIFELVLSFEAILRTVISLIKSSEFSLHFLDKVLWRSVYKVLFLEVFEHFIIVWRPWRGFLVLVKGFKSEGVVAQSGFLERASRFYHLLNHLSAVLLCVSSWSLVEEKVGSF